MSTREPKLKAYSPSFHPKDSNPRWCKRPRSTLLLSILSLCILYKTLRIGGWIPSTDLPAPTPEQFQWDQITPSKTLQYTACFDGFQCARLDIPLDWNNTDGPRASMAIVKLPAKVPVVDARYGGIIVLNPGGPGGSGVSNALHRARGIQTIADSEAAVSGQSNSEKYFDIMSFDPRGVNNSSPKLKSFPDAFSEYRWKIQSEDDGTLETDFEKVYVRSQTMSASLSRANDPETGIGRFTNTSPVVADMVEFIEQHGKWREEQARRWLTSGEGRYQIQKYRALENQILERTRWREGEEKLQYWGFSYGTVLGSTFSAMQPHRVERVILDGNVPLADYYRGDWAHNLRDTDAIMDKFVEYCHRGGPESCPMYESNESAIMDKIETLLSSLKKSPRGVLASESRGPEIITYKNVMSLIRDSLYAPLREFPQLAAFLEDLVSGNGSAFADYKRANSKPICTTPSQSSCEPVEDDSIASLSILCSDGEGYSNATKEEFKAYVAELQSHSRWLGTSWGEIKLACMKWELRPKWRFAGPIAGNTSHPLLILNPTLDPVTPLAIAHVTASRFNGSVVLEHSAEGHCTYAAPSLCTAKHVRNYFQTGHLPAPNTVCLPERRPFIGSIRSPDEPELSPGDRKLLDALEELTRVGSG